MDNLTDQTNDATDLVTGAFGNIGGAIAERLLSNGRSVRTLTGSRVAGKQAIDVRPFEFDDPAAVRGAFEGVNTFYNTFWVRTGDRSGQYDLAIERSRILIEAAAVAGVERIVQMSVIKPSPESPYAYFRAKAEVERLARSTGVPVACVRPALVFGPDAPLFENLAWILRRAPLFGVAGDGSYRVRPVHVDDVADLCVDLGSRSNDVTVDAVGPERPTYIDMVRALRDAIGCRTRIVRMNPRLVLASSRIMGIVLKDDLVTRDELLSTMEGIADSDEPATGSVLLSEWLRTEGPELGLRYHNERRRRARLARAGE